MPQAGLDRLEADPGAVAERGNEQGGDQSQAAPDPPKGVQPPEQDQTGGQRAHEGAAAQREDQGHRHDQHGDEGQIAAHGLLTTGRRAEEASKRRASALPPRAGEQTADPEKDQHAQPGSEVVGIRERPGQAARAVPCVPPPEKPGIPPEIVEEREERQPAAQHQQGAHQPLELGPRPDEVDHEHVGAHVGQEDAQGVDRVGAGERAQGQHQRGGRGSAPEIAGRTERPRQQWPVAEDQLKEDEDDEQPDRPVDRRRSPGEPPLGHHPEQPAE